VRPYRDQTRRTYRAELEVFRSAPINKAIPHKRAQKLVIERLPAWRVVSNETFDQAWCYLDLKRISLGKKSPAWMLCHELAHARVEEAGLPTGHHAVFRFEYLEVVEDIIGKGWRGSLEKGFRGAGLPVCRSGEQPGSWFSRLW